VNKEKELQILLMPTDHNHLTMSATKQNILNYIVENVPIADTSLIKELLAKSLLCWAQKMLVKFTTLSKKWNASSIT
jgi:hypothetical protein